MKKMTTVKLYSIEYGILEKNTYKKIIDNFHVKINVLLLVKNEWVVLKIISEVFS